MDCEHRPRAWSGAQLAICLRRSLAILVTAIDLGPPRREQKYRYHLRGTGKHSGKTCQLSLQSRLLYQKDSRNGEPRVVQCACLVIRCPRSLRIESRARAASYYRDRLDYRLHPLHVSKSRNNRQCVGEGAPVSPARIALSARNESETEAILESHTSIACNECPEDWLQPSFYLQIVMMRHEKDQCLWVCSERSGCPASLLSDRISLGLTPWSRWWKVTFSSCQSCVECWCKSDHSSLPADVSISFG